MLRRACLWQILPALLLGAATTVIVAWVLQCLPKYPFPMDRFFYSNGSIIEGDFTGDVTVSYFRGSVEYTATSRTVRTNGRGPVPKSVRPSEIAPPWILQQLSLENDRIFARWVTTQGWPCRSLWSVETILMYRDANGPAAGQEHRGQIPIPDSLSTRLNLSKTDSLCWYVIPFGFIADTALFASAWWLLLFIPPTTRHYLRRRRNLCPTCAYNLQGLPPLSPCPECGRT